jgi:hypothetical protein
MELSPSGGAAKSAATQEFPSNLWNPKVHHRVHKSPPLVPILSQIYQSIPSHLMSLRSILILSTHLHLGLPCGLFPSGYMTCPPHPPWLDHSNYTWRRVQIMKLLIMQFSPTSCHFTSLGPNILLSTLSLCSSLNVRAQVSHPYRITGKIIVLYILTVHN